MQIRGERAVFDCRKGTTRTSSPTSEDDHTLSRGYCFKRKKRQRVKKKMSDKTAVLTTAFRAPPSVPVLGITGGVLGGLIGALFCIFSLGIIWEYYAGYYPASSAPLIRSTFLASFGILAFSVIGALCAVQKLDSRSTVNAGGLFLAGGAVLVFMFT